MPLGACGLVVWQCIAFATSFLLASQTTSVAATATCMATSYTTTKLSQNEPFVVPESAELFAAIAERSWGWTPTNAGVFREKTMVPSSPDFLQLAEVLARPPDPPASQATRVQRPAAADFGLDTHAAVRAVTVAYLQTVRNLAPASIEGSKHVFHPMLEAESLARQSDGLGIQGRLAKVLNLDAAVSALLRRALSCAKDMGQHPAVLRSVWRPFASPDVARDFNLADDFTYATMARDIGESALKRGSRLGLRCL